MLDLICDGNVIVSCLILRFGIFIETLIYMNIRYREWRFVDQSVYFSMAEICVGLKNFTRIVNKKNLRTNLDFDKNLILHMVVFKFSQRWFVHLFKGSV